MRFLYPNSLSQTIDALSAALFFRQEIPAERARKAVAFIASRHGLPGAYAGTYALFPRERREGIRLFTGELAAAASARHIAAEEACRVLLRLQPRPAATRAALRAAGETLLQRVGPAAPRDSNPDDGPDYWNWDFRGGTYCCGPCTVGFWRHLLAGGFDQHATRLARGLACLRTMRKADHTWRTFPFWYTLSALVEMPPMKAALDEMRFVAPACRKAAARHPSEPYAARRAEIARRLLARI
jgi:hypothetical protein